MAYVRLLRNNPGFARLWLAQVISLTGDWFNTIALSALVVEYSGGSGLAVSALLLARAIPLVVVNPLAGVLADRFDRKRLLILSDVLRAVVVLMLLLVQGPEMLWLIYALTLVQFSLSSVFGPAYSAIVPSLVPHDGLVRANTLGSITWSAMLAVGAIAGGVVATLFGAAAALVFDALTFLISALLISQIKTPLRAGPRAPGVEALAAPPVEARGFVDGLRYAARHPATAMTLLVKVGLGVVNSDALLVVYGTKIFPLGEDGTASLGALYAAFGVGAVIGPLVLNRFNNGSIPVMRRLISVGFVMIVIGWAVLGGAPSLLAVALAFGIRAMGGSANWTYSSVILQERVHDAFLGRIFALDMTANQLVSIVGTLVTGALIEAFGTTQLHVVALAAALTTVAPLLIWTAAIPWMDRRDRRDESEATAQHEALAAAR